MPRIWLNGALAEAGDAAVSAMDRGFLYGDGIYETILILDGIPVFWQAHWERAKRAAAKLELTMPFGEKDLHAGLALLMEAEGIANGVVRLTVSRGPGERGLLPPSFPGSTITIGISAGTPYNEAVYTTGLRAVTMSWPRNERSPLAGIKSLNALENVLGAMAARRAGTHEGIFFNTAGYLAEGAMTNIFVVKDGLIVTPPDEAGLLPGIARGALLSGWPGIETRMVDRAELLAADEAFLTNSVLGVAPLVELDGAGLGSGRPGRATRRIMRWYEELLRAAR